MSKANENSNQIFDAIVIAQVYQECTNYTHSVNLGNQSKSLKREATWEELGIGIVTPAVVLIPESYSYAYSFSKDLLEEWDWTEHFSPQPETLKYLQYVAKKFDLKKDIQFNPKVNSANYNSETDMGCSNR